MKFTRLHALLLVSACAFLALAINAASAGSASYEYDSQGRLSAVTDSNGNSAGYHYDAAGNLTSITTGSSTTPSISNFSPISGPAGTQVTISGANFSVVQGQFQGAVKFNGVAATVSSATSTTLLVAVPAGATTGPISVQGQSGSYSR